jgi:hypothetical protein
MADTKFPIFKHSGGQWCKKVKGRHYYFGSWATDPDGEQALADWLGRKEGILAGMDRLRVYSTPDGMTLGDLMGRYLENRRQAMLAGDLALTTYRGYLTELEEFANTVGTGATVAAIRPEHFSAYAKHLMAERKLGRHSRRRTLSYVKAMLNWGSGMGFYPPPTYGNDFVAPDTRPDAIRQAKAREGKPDYSRRIVTGDEIDQMVNWFGHRFNGNPQE